MSLNQRKKDGDHLDSQSCETIIQLLQNQRKPKYVLIQKSRKLYFTLSS